MSLFTHVFLRSTALVVCLFSVAIAAGEKKIAPAVVKADDAAKETTTTPAPVIPAAVDDDQAAEKVEAEDTAKVARPVTSDPVQVYGWREKIKLVELPEQFTAKLDTGAYTSSLHAENEQIFERDGKKWVKFVCTDPRQVGAKRYDMEAPLMRTVHIKEPGEQSERRNVVRLSFTIGDRKMKADFSLNDRRNMLCPVLIGRSTIAVLGWVDPSRTFMADDKIMR
jgi:hypothetical protein